MSGLLGGGGKSIDTSAPVITSFRLQTSAFGRPIAWIFGRTRVSGNLLDYDDFTAIPHTTSTDSGGGKGGSAPTQTNTTYTYRAAVIIALGRGPLTSLHRIWKGKELQNAADLGMSFFAGDASQVPFGYMTTNHPDKALGYRGIAYVAAGAYDLGDNAELPNHNFEVQATAYSGSIVDANPKDVVASIFTDGLGWSAGTLGDLSGFSSYCVATGIFISPAYSEQESYQAVLERLMQLGNAGPLWSEDKLKIIPFGDSAITGNGVTFTPNLTPLYDLSDDDFLQDGDDEPVRVRRSTPEDAYNQVTVMFYDRAKDYNENQVVAQDLGNIQLYGVKAMDPVVLHEICETDIAQRVADLILRRELYTERNIHEFRLGTEYSLVEPGDLMTVPDPITGDRISVRMWTIDEDPVEGFQCEAKEFPFGTASAAVYGSQPVGGYTLDFNVDPGNVNPPIMFIAPLSLTPNWLEVWVAISGGEEFGGSEIWVSEDDSTYRRLGTFLGKSRTGLTTTAMNIVASPDNTTVLGVNLAQSKAELSSGSEEDANRLNTLCYAGGELLAYRTAELTAPNQYNLTGLRRGAYGSEVRVVPAGSVFARIDENGIFKYAFPPEWNGRLIYLKFAAFNRTGGGRQDLSALSPYTFRLSQQFAGLPAMRDVTGLELFGAAGGTVFTGRDAKFTWRHSGGTRAFDLGSEPFGAGSGGIDPNWKDYQIEVWRADGTAKLREPEHSIDNFYTYTYEKSFEDSGGAPVRTFELRVYSRGQQGQLSAVPARLNVSNPNSALPGGVNIRASFKNIFFGYAPPNESDWAGLLVWRSTSTGFTASGVQAGAGNCVYNGRDSLVVLDSAPNTAYFLRYAAYDSFGTADLNVSGELAATTEQIDAVDIKQHAVQQSHLFQSLSDRIDLVDAPAATPGSVDARVATEAAARASADSALATSISTVSASTVTNAAAITSEATARAAADSSLATSISTVAATAASNTAAISTEATARAAADSALSSSISTVAATAASNTAAISTESTARAGADGTLFAQYTVKIDVNGKVAGFGLASTANNATPFSEFVVRADRFSVAGTGAADVIPFIVEGGVVYLDAARIKNAAIVNAQINDLSADKLTAGDIAAARMAANFLTVAQAEITELSAISSHLGDIDGGSLDINGLFIVTSAGEVTIKSATSGARTEFVGDVYKVYDASNVLRVKIGNLA
jgi:hypothetical protein